LYDEAFVVNNFLPREPWKSNLHSHSHAAYAAATQAAVTLFVLDVCDYKGDRCQAYDIYDSVRSGVNTILLWRYKIASVASSRQTCERLVAKFDADKSRVACRYYRTV
jgi:hypothetical protein